MDRLINGKKVFSRGKTEIIINTGVYSLSFKQVDLIFRVIEKTFRTMNYYNKTQISISLVLPSEIKKINQEFRNKDCVTDVLSFPIDYYGGILGDVVICVKRMALQAVEYGNSFDRELAYLVVHSILHLLGFDHIEPRDKKIMRYYEKVIMKELVI